MKYFGAGVLSDDLGVAPHAGAWIEIPDLLRGYPPVWLSPPSRGAWIEIRTLSALPMSQSVAPLAGGVD